MKLFVAITGHASLWPHFLRHYSDLGVDEFYASVDPGLSDSVALRADGFPVTLVSGTNANESIEGGTEAVTRMRAQFSSADEWVALADLDEFQVHPAGIIGAIEAAEAESANVVRGVFVDRVAHDGSLPAIDEATDLWSRFPERCALTAFLQGGLDYKCVLVKGQMVSARTAAGLSLAHHHLDGERIASARAEIHHFKWNSELLERIETAIVRTKAAGQPFWTEYVRVLEHWSKHGRLRWEDFPEIPTGT